jgi:hypothetical protein
LPPVCRLEHLALVKIATLLARGAFRHKSQVTIWSGAPASACRAYDGLALSISDERRYDSIARARFTAIPTWTIRCWSIICIRFTPCRRGASAVMCRLRCPSGLAWELMYRPQQGM